MGTSSGRDPVVKTGDVIEGRYRIIRTLGEGGMGTVFLAEHALIKRRVAIKILHPELATDANVIERFMNEARAAGTLGHPNIVESTDMGFTPNHVPYIVFEYLEGTLLTDEIYRVGGLPVRRAIRVASQIASALQAAHNAGIVHRDLKSDNVFLTDKDDALDHVKVLDFGVSRFMETDDAQRNMVIGTPEFMAPEQITDPGSVDRRADIYALGVILYEMLTARRPFSQEDDPRQLMHRIVHEVPPPLQRPEVPVKLQEIILTKLLAKDPAHRLPTMNDVEAALETFLTRSDGSSARRRGQATDAPDARTSGTIPPPSKMLNTPWPPGKVDTLDQTGASMLNSVALPTAPSARKPIALYAIAAIGVIVGGLGLAMGLRGGNNTETKTAENTQTATTQQPQPGAAIPQRSSEVQKVEVQIDADAPNSRVVFRRRVAAAPATQLVSPSDIVELVEVSAPGYKTARYWLTFDRPTHLKAHLTKGNGSSEATEEDTLAALGEVSGNTPPVIPSIIDALPQVPAAAAAAIKAEPKKGELVATATQASPRTVEARTTLAPTMAPRKIGRGGAEVPPADNLVATMSVPDAPAMKARAIERPEPETAKAEATSAKEETRAEPAKIEAMQPKAEPATMPVEQPKPQTVQPTIDYGTVTAVVGQHRPEVLKCFADGKKKNPAMKGTLNLQLQVDGSGRVHRVQVQSTLGAPLVAACVVKSANAWHFPGRAGGDFASVNYPFTIN